ncbi:MAG: hypothetical protein DRN81_01975 [Thermoproteota archaeon]|nr:MAG: hypothetical protein DRN81_01975 [Candidatus Korarchaeota archaeon]
MIIATVTFRDKKQKVIWNEERRNFKNISAAMKGVKEEFGITGKTEPMFVDTKTGKTKKVGFVKSYWERYDDSGKRFPAEMWVSFDECKPVNMSKASVKKKLKKLM